MIVYSKLSMTAIYASHDTLINSDLRAVLYKCDTMNLRAISSDVQLTLDDAL